MHTNIKLLAWFNFFTDFKLYAPIAILYFSEVSGSFALGMSVFSVVMVSSAFFEIPTGVFSDRIGRRKTLILGAVSASVAAILYAVGISFWILILGAIFEGLSRSFYSGNNDALLHETLAQTNQQSNYAEFLGKTGSMFQAALAVSAVFGSILAVWSFSLIMWLSVIPQLLCVIVAYFIQEPKNHSHISGNIFSHLKDAYINFIRNKKLRLLSLSHVVGYGFGEAGFQFQSAFYATLWPVWAIGFAKTISYCLAMLSYRVSGKLIKKFGAVEIVIVDNLYNRFINILSTIFPTVLSPFLMSSTSLFHGLTTVAKSTLMQKEFTSVQRATMGSLNSFVGSLFFGVIAFTLGILADSLSPATALLILQILQISNLWIYWKLFKHSS